MVTILTVIRNRLHDLFEMHTSGLPSFSDNDRGDLSNITSVFLHIQVKQPKFLSLLGRAWGVALWTSLEHGCVSSATRSC
jgi:hypothetical protein